MFHRLFYTCEEASLYTLKKEEGKVSLLTRFRLWMHTQVCHLCKIFHLQNDKLNEMVKSSQANKAIRASEEAKLKWKNELLSNKDA